MIVTSFNWLSFAGRSDLGNRVEFGVLMRDKAAVADMKMRLSQMMGIPLAVFA